MIYYQVQAGRQAGYLRGGFALAVCAHPFLPHAPFALQAHTHTYSWWLVVVAGGRGRHPVACLPVMIKERAGDLGAREKLRSMGGGKGRGGAMDQGLHTPASLPLQGRPRGRGRGGIIWTRRTRVSHAWALRGRASPSSPRGTYTRTPDPGWADIGGVRSSPLGSMADGLGLGAWFWLRGGSVVVHQPSRRLVPPNRVLVCLVPPDRRCPGDGGGGGGGLARRPPPSLAARARAM